MPIQIPTTWVMFATHMGSVVGKADTFEIENPSERSISVYDACTIVEDDITGYVTATNIKRELDLIDKVWEEDEAISAGFIDPVTEEDLIQVVIDKREDYLPIRENEDPLLTIINLVKTSIVFWYPIGEREDLDQYINQAMNRIDVKKVISVISPEADTPESDS
jgi:hypothetical protein